VTCKCFREKIILCRLLDAESFRQTDIKRVRKQSRTLYRVRNIFIAWVFFLQIVKEEGEVHTSAMVSLAIISSSSVGMTHTVTLLSGVEMMASSPRTVLFLALSSDTPR